MDNSVLGKMDSIPAFFAYANPPKEISILIFGFLNPTELNTARLVHSTWQKAIDGNCGLWMNLVYSIKDRSFTSESLANPKNFLVFDRDVTRVFKKTLPRHIHEYDFETQTLFEATESFELGNLDLGLIYFMGHQNLSFPSYCPIEREMIEEIKQANCCILMEWERVIEKVLKIILAFRFPLEGILEEENDFFDIREKCLTLYNRPNAAMRTLIDKYRITHMFMDKRKKLIILSDRVKELNFSHILKAVSDERIKLKIFNRDLLDAFHESITIFNDPEATIAHLSFDSSLKKQIKERLKNQSTFMQEDLSTWLQKTKSIHPFFEPIIH